MNGHCHGSSPLFRVMAGLDFFRFLDGFVNAAHHIERLFGQMVQLAGQDHLEATNGFLQGNILAGRAGEHFRHVERLGQETLDTTGAGYSLLVLFRQFVHTQNRDDVLQFLVALQVGLYAAGYFIMLGADNQRIELATGGIQRVDRRVDTLGSDVTAQYHGGVQVGEGGGRRRVGQVVRRYVNRLDRGDGTGLGRSDAFLQGAHLFRQSRLITYGGRHPAQQCGYFGSRQGVTVDVVNEQQNVTAFVTEFFRHGQTGQGHAQTVAGWLVHLAVHHRYLGIAEGLGVNNTGFLHFVVEVITFAGPLTHTGKHRQTGVLGSDVVDQFHHVHGLAHAGATEQTHFTALGERTYQVDNLDAGFQQLVTGCLLSISRGLAVNRHAFLFADGAALVDRIAQHIHDAAERFEAHRHADRLAGAVHGQAALQTFGTAHRNGAHHAITQLLLNFQHCGHGVNIQRIVHLGYGIARKFDVDNRADDLNNTSATHVAILLNQKLTGLFRNRSSQSLFATLCSQAGPKTVRPNTYTAAAPLTISEISWVIAA